MGVSRAELIKLIKDQGNRGIQLCGARAFTEELISDEVMEALEASKTQELQTDEGIAAWIPLESSSGVLLGLIKIVKAGSEKLDPAEADFLKRLAKAVSSLVEQFDQVTFKKAS